MTKQAQTHHHLDPNDLMALPEQLGLSQREFCQAFGLHYGDFRKLRCGKSQMSGAHFAMVRLQLEKIYAIAQEITKQKGTEKVHMQKVRLELRLAQIEWKKCSDQYHAMQAQHKRIAWGIAVLQLGQWAKNKFHILVSHKQTARLNWLTAQIEKKEEHLARLDFIIARCQRAIQSKEAERAKSQGKVLTPKSKRKDIATSAVEYIV
jgi:hypothetical protein